MGIVPSRYEAKRSPLRQRANPTLNSELRYAEGQLLNGYAQMVSQQTGIGTGLTNITGLSVTVKIGASRRIKIIGNVIAIGNTAASSKVALYILEGATRLGFGEESLQAAPNNSSNVIAERIFTPSAGSHTYNLAFQFTSGAANIAYTDPSNGQYSYIIVEDIGAV